MTLQALRHPNVLQYLGACMMPPNLVMVTEHMPHSLHSVLYTMKGVDVDRKKMVAMLQVRCPRSFLLQGFFIDFFYSQDIARAFVYLHSRKPAVVHRCEKSSSTCIQERAKFALSFPTFTKEVSLSCCLTPPAPGISSPLIFWSTGRGV